MRQQQCSPLGFFKYFKGTEGISCKWFVLVAKVHFGAVTYLDFCTAHRTAGVAFWPASVSLSALPK